MPQHRAVISKPAASAVGGSSPYAWTMPSEAVRIASTKRVFSHYFPPYPPAIYDTAGGDYYTSHYLVPGNEGPLPRNYGSYMRDAPRIRARPRGGNYMLADMQDEVRWAWAAGIDGWCLNIMSTNTTHYLWERVLLMLQAVAVVPEFRVILMPDMYVLTDQQALADRIGEVAGNQQIEKFNGKIVVCPFFAERVGAAWWQTWMSMMVAQKGVQVSFMPCGLNPSIAAFDDFSFGISYWGSGNTAQITADVAIQVQAAAREFMMPIRPQDYRPSQYIYDEAGNTDALRDAWDISNTYAKYVQLITWNDYMESTHFCPSRLNGTAMLDLQSYFIAKFKTGTYPTITRDALFLSHRTHTVAATSPSQAGRATLRNGSTAARDTVEVLAFLTTARTVNIVINGSSTAHAVGAGMQIITRTLPAATSGVISANIQGTGTTVTSPSALEASPSYQNMMYHLSSSEPATS